MVICVHATSQVFTLTIGALTMIPCKVKLSEKAQINVQVNEISGI